MKQYNEHIRNKFFNYFKQRLKLKESTKGWFRADCYYCGGNFSMGINFETKRLHCFKCGEQKTPIQLLMEIEGFTLLQQAYTLLNLQEEYEQYEGRSITKIDYKPIELPQSFKIIGSNMNAQGRSATNYLAKRGFNIDDLAQKGVGYCTQGQYDGYIIFPFYQRGKLVFFQGRRFMPSAGPKMRNPEEAEFGIGKTQILYNADALYLYEKAYLVESITNAETLGDNAAASLGKKVSPQQLSQLIHSPCKKIVIGLDRDAITDAIGLAMQLVNYKKIKLLIPPTDADINDMGRKAARQLERESNYVTYNELFRLKLNYAETERSYN